MYKSGHLKHVLLFTGVGVVEELRLIVGTHTLEAHVCGTEEFSLPTVELYLNKGEVKSLNKLLFTQVSYFIRCSYVLMRSW